MDLDDQDYYPRAREPLRPRSCREYAMEAMSKMPPPPLPPVKVKVVRVYVDSKPSPGLRIRRKRGVWDGALPRSSYMSTAEMISDFADSERPAHPEEFDIWTSAEEYARDAEAKRDAEAAFAGLESEREAQRQELQRDDGRSDDS
jgi:hypothetical protein